MNLFPGLQKLLLFCLIQLAVHVHANGQTRVYEAFVEGNKIGEMQVIREINDESEKITITTHLRAHLFSNESVRTESHSTYMDGKLTEATSTREINGRLQRKVTTSFFDGKLIVVRDGSEQQSKRGTVYGNDLLYCEEPGDIDEVLDLSSGDFVAVKHSEGHVYYFTQNEKMELYRYENGLLGSLEIEHKHYTVVFKLKQ